MSGLESMLEQVRSALADRPLVVFVITFLAMWLATIAFSLALTRYDQRKNLEAEEANAIGTAWVRADLLPAGDVAKLRDALKEYLEQRILYDVVRDPDQAARTAVLQAAMWAAVAAAANAQPTAVNALAVSGIKDALNSQGYTHAAWRNRIPFTAWALLASLALFCSLLAGYEVQRGQAGRVLPLVLAISVSIACSLIRTSKARATG